MKFCIATILLGLTLIGPAQAQDPIKPTLLVTGDSLSAEYGIARGTGWVALLSNRLKQEGSSWEIMNASISGETTSGGLTRLPKLLAQKKPKLVIIELGANDALRGLPLVETEKNIRTMVELSKKSGADVLLIGMRIPPNYGQEYTQQFAGLFARIAKSQQVALLPFFLEGVAQRNELFQADRIHPNEAAQAIMFQNVWTALTPFYGLLLKK
ncbi:arylesterase [Polynucleobacter sp.]|uniref:arylesterase n=1 Tax=Polynucleobacter sp. TaxID=2029855 RepID=UPI002736FCCC|nr:arylesterase [Polynucleobacter sp.]MDP3121044.1 arylesterase [Polynucleobacter sp.]